MKHNAYRLTKVTSSWGVELFPDTSPVTVLSAGFSARPSLQRRTARSEFDSAVAIISYFWKVFGSGPRRRRDKAVYDPGLLDQLKRPSSAEGPYSAGTGASLRRKYTVNCPRWWARWLNTESAIIA